MVQARSIWKWILRTPAVLVFVGALNASDRSFSVPLDDLRTWSEHVVTAYNVTILGNSKVHKASADCEMHFGARSSTYRGDPNGFVLEPMNLCVEPFGDKTMQSDKDWLDYAKSLRGAVVRVEGVPRIWPEHLVGGGDSNPDHAVEIHPVTKLQRGNQVLRFEKFIYPTEGFDGGVGEETATKILTELEVSVREDHGSVEVNFDAGRIGNFTTLSLAIFPDTVTEVEGSHRMDGEVVLTKTHRVPVRLVTVAGSKIDAAVAKRKGSKRKFALEALVLFSLSPEALFRAAKDSHGAEMPVRDPIQLIIFGEPEQEE